MPRRLVCVFCFCCCCWTIAHGFNRVGKMCRKPQEHVDIRQTSDCDMTEYRVLAIRRRQTKKTKRIAIQTRNASEQTMPGGI